MLAGLPERKRGFLTAKVAGYSYDEIAAELNVSWLTVNRQLMRARGALRDARDGARGLRGLRRTRHCERPGTQAFRI